MRKFLFISCFVFIFFACKASVEKANFNFTGDTNADFEMLRDSLIGAWAEDIRQNSKTKTRVKIDYDEYTVVGLDDNKYYAYHSKLGNCIAVLVFIDCKDYKEQEAAYEYIRTILTEKFGFPENVQDVRVDSEKKEWYKQWYGTYGIYEGLAWRDHTEKYLNFGYVLSNFDRQPYIRFTMFRYLVD